MEKVYKFNATLIVEGAKSKKDAINQLQVMLNDYDDMNEDNIGICISNLKSVKE